MANIPSDSPVLHNGVKMVNQVEYHPNLTQKELHSFCIQEGIQEEMKRIDALNKNERTGADPDKFNF